MILTMLLCGLVALFLIFLAGLAMLFIFLPVYYLLAWAIKK